MADSLPLFPLRAVLLPGANLPLHIFEPRYRQLTADLMSGALPDRRFGVIALKPSMEREVTSVEQLTAIGCSAVLRHVDPLPDGRFDIITTGERRFRLLALDSTSAPYLMGEVEWVPDAEQALAAESVSMLAESARSAHRRYCTAAWRTEDWSEPADDTETRELAHALAADCLLSVEDRQELLEEVRPLHRLRLVGRLLNREAGFLTALRAVPAPPSHFSEPICLN
ncbi:LON peptidase substrate-binding domain-containing protein [Actinokineospora bangkokensis]|uniref:Peptidase n=1 Tax=Actinokineospora bangkokensis TaxID=1193682 RepID=A0A1Q9LQC0_9PSEU|nr:LON peptidase substrate-binding domain-containing protein [Actinokineospora bangkokensis]OLR94220.1 peptidase [Actinokineospora bangkokensis]